MVHVRTNSPEFDEIEDDFIQALERLKMGQPTNKKLKEKVANGSLKINISSVALEAGRARTLIALVDNCRYPKVRRLVQDAMLGKISLPTNRDELIKKLRSENAELTAELKMMKALVLAHFDARTKAEEEAISARETAARLRKKISETGKIADIVRGRT